MDWLASDITTDLDNDPKDAMWMGHMCSIRALQQWVHRAGVE